MRIWILILEFKGVKGVTFGVLKRSVNRSTFEFLMFKGREVKESRAALNPNKSAGQDKISAKLLRLASKELAPSLTKIVNGCTENECWPKEWKRGVFKKDDH